MCFSSAEWRGRITYLVLLAILYLMHPGISYTLQFLQASTLSELQLFRQHRYMPKVFKFLLCSLFLLPPPLFYIFKTQALLCSLFSQTSSLYLCLFYWVVWWTINVVGGECLQKPVRFPELLYPLEVSPMWSHLLVPWMWFVLSIPLLSFVA